MAEKKVTLSIAIAVFNESKNIEACLNSVVSIADEIVLVDGGSTDDTVNRVGKYHADVIKTDNPPIFHINKQKAIDNCHSDWILQLDADEVVTDDLKKEIVSTINGDTKNNTNGYYIPRSNYFWGHFMKKGGQYPDEVIRLIKRGKGSLPCKSVHEQMVVSGNVGHLTHPMLHYTYRSRADYWKKSMAYTDLTATELSNTHANPVLSGLQYCLIKPVSVFLSLYFRHKGFMDGLTGLEFSLYSAMHFPIAYMKYIRR